MSKSKPIKNSTITNQDDLLMINEAVGDYRTRYELPDHWVFSPNGPFGMEYLGYISIAVNILRKYIPISGGTGTSPLVFDIGCGDGRFSAEIIRAGYRLSGFDYNERALGFARVFNPEASFQLADLTSTEVLPSQEGKERPQAIAMIEVLEHIHPKHYKNLLGLLRDIIDANGVFLISVPNKELPLNRLWHYLHFSEEDFQSVLEKNGWHIEERIYNYRLSHPIVWFIRYGWRFIDNRLWRFHFLCGWFAKMYTRWCNTCKANQRPGRFIFVCKPKVSP